MSFNPIENLKLPTSIKWIMWIASILYLFVAPLVIDLIKDSNVFLELKQSKPIDSLLSMGIPINMSTEAILISLIILSLLFNLFLLKRMNLYISAAKIFGDQLFKISLKCSSATGKHIAIKYNNTEHKIDAKDYDSKFIDSL